MQRRGAHPHDRTSVVTGKQVCKVKQLTKHSSDGIVLPGAIAPPSSVVVVGGEQSVVMALTTVINCMQGVIPVPAHTSSTSRNAPEVCL